MTCIIGYSTKLNKRLLRNIYVYIIKKFIFTNVLHVCSKHMLVLQAMTIKKISFLWSVCNIFQTNFQVRYEYKIIIFINFSSSYKKFDSN